MIGILIDQNGTVSTKTSKKFKLDELQKLVTGGGKGRIEGFPSIQYGKSPLLKKLVAYVDEEGQLKSSCKRNTVAEQYFYNSRVFGNVFLIRQNGKGELTSLTKEDVKTILGYVKDE